MAHTKSCPNCAGSGLVSRPVAALAENAHVQRYLTGMPHAGQETCSKCGGSGGVLMRPEDVPDEDASG